MSLPSANRIAAKKVLDELRTRKGFRQLIDDLDEDILEEITTALTLVISQARTPL